MMFQFYKKRDFGQMMSDTFSFFKIYGKNYFKNYLLLNGLLLIMLVVLVIGGFKEIVMQIFEGNIDGRQYYFEQYFQENMGILVILSILITLLFIAIFIINYAFPVFYLKRLSEGQSTDITMEEMLQDFKNNIGKLAILILGGMFIVFPLMMVVLGISFVLIFFLVGIVMLLILAPMMGNVYQFLMYDYLHTSRGFFESLQYSIISQFRYQDRHSSPFWKYWASSIVINIVVQIIMYAISIIPMMIWIGSLATSLEAGETPDEAMGLTIVFFYCFYFLAAFILSNLNYINAGLMYYDSRIDLHRKMEMVEIDQIGKNEA